MSESAGPVVYDRDDYASPLKRIISFAIDFIVLMFLLAMLRLGVAAVVVPGDALKGLNQTQQTQEVNRRLLPYRTQLNFGIIAVVLVYHVLLRTLPGGTIGYRLTGTRLINEYGRPPELRTAMRRFVFGAPGCLCFLASYLKCLSDPYRQAMHDHYAGTWLVRKHATPIGPAIIEYQQKMIGPWPLQYPVLSPAPEDIPTSETEPALATPDKS